MSTAPVPHTAKNLLILLWAATPKHPEQCAMPFVYAATGAAMELGVEMHFTGPSVRLLIEGVAAGIRVSNMSEKTIYDTMRDAAQLGVRFLACSTALREHTQAHEAKIAEFSGVAGAATVVMRSLDPEWRTLTF
ncbi:MAG: hypothetical protein ABIZ09_05335 [Rhodoferax sp.]